MKQAEMAFLTDYWWQNRKDCPNRTTNNEDMTERVKRSVSESVTYM